jgi:hypothetical protein
MRPLLLMHFLLFYSTGKSQQNKIPNLNNNFLKENTDTLILNNQKIIRNFKDEKLESLVTLSGDTVLKNCEQYSNVYFIDINNDGYKDIRAYAFSNTPNQCENYLFDIKKRNFRFIENCDLDIQPIKGTKYFYSYIRAGCADLNWESHLLKIENWKATIIGFINAKGCGDHDDGIYIYKVSSKEETLIQSQSIKLIARFKEKKIGFIKNYWIKNYKAFLN